MMMKVTRWEWRMRDKGYERWAMRVKSFKDKGEGWRLKAVVGHSLLDYEKFCGWFKFHDTVKPETNIYYFLQYCRLVLLMNVWNVFSLTKKEKKRKNKSKECRNTTNIELSTLHLFTNLPISLCFKLCKKATQAFILYLSPCGFCALLAKSAENTRKFKYCQNIEKSSRPSFPWKQTNAVKNLAFGA